MLICREISASLPLGRNAQRSRQGAGDGFISPAPAASQARGQAPSGGASVGGVAVPLRWLLFKAQVVGLPFPIDRFLWPFRCAGAYCWLWRWYCLGGWSSRPLGGVDNWEGEPPEGRGNPGGVPRPWPLSPVEFSTTAVRSSVLKIYKVKEPRARVTGGGKRLQALWGKALKNCPVGEMTIARWVK